MKNIIDRNPYEIIFNALLNNGYTENEAEELICEVIEEQIEYSNFAERIHSILCETNNSDNWS